MRLNSVDALKGKSDDPRVRETLTYSLRYDSNPGVRLQALEGLRLLVKDDIRVRNAVLEALLNDSNLGVRSGALHSLEPVKADSSVRMALQQLAKEDPERLHSSRSPSDCWPRRRRCTDKLDETGNEIKSGEYPLVENYGRGRAGRSDRARMGPDSRVFRDGNGWVEETTGILPPGREFRALTDLGALQVQGTASQVSYVVRKRSSESTNRRHAKSSSNSALPPASWAMW